ncbi:MAG: YkgJ family cysteine cluster protein [Chloroflexi bacterium]|nr:YkgJ family cysteine cluster protein [Chloroflexota bacterium]MDA1219502.1 YkgJ family cysteine cluster protein [Chloroflexota bacterium]
MPPPPYLMSGLTPESASDICMNQCRAMCCRGPLILTLTEAELRAFEQNALALGVALKVGKSPDAGGWVKFADHVGECCPMLDQSTFACRVYAARPQRCRDFPEKLTPGCAISGG